MCLLAVQGEVLAATAAWAARPLNRIVPLSICVSVGPPRSLAFIPYEELSLTIEIFGGRKYPECGERRHGLRSNSCFILCIFTEVPRTFYIEKSHLSKSKTMGRKAFCKWNSGVFLIFVFVFIVRSPPFPFFGDGFAIQFSLFDIEISLLQPTESWGYRCVLPLLAPALSLRSFI